MKSKMIAILIPGTSWASGTTGGYILLSLLLSIPSFIAIGVLFWFVIEQSKKKEFKIIKVGLICMLVLFVGGICFSTHGILVPNWVAFKSGNYLLPIVYSIIINIALLVLYKKKWNKNNKNS